MENQQTTGRAARSIPRSVAIFYVQGMPARRGGSKKNGDNEQVEILRAIWNEMKALNSRIDKTNASLDAEPCAFIWPRARMALTTTSSGAFALASSNAVKRSAPAVP